MSFICRKFVGCDYFFCYTEIRKGNQHLSFYFGGDLMFQQYLLTGATGYLGQTIIEQLLEKNAKISALVMNNDPLVKELPKEVEIVYGNVCDKDSLEPFFAQANKQTCVIHCAGIISVASKNDDRIYKVNVGGTKNIIKCCLNHNVGKLVYISSVHSIPEKPKGIVITEEAQFLPELVEGDYAKSKAMATALVLEAAKQGLNTSVVFPSGIIGPGDKGQGSVTDVLLSFMAGKLPIAVTGGYDFVDVRDVASGIIACSEKGLPGKGYILSGHYATVKDILEIIKKLFNLKYKVTYLPLIFAKIFAYFNEKWCLYKKKPLSITPYAVSVLDSNGQFSSKAASEAFGYKPRPLENTLKDTIAWLKETGRC